MMRHFYYCSLVLIALMATNGDKLNVIAKQVVRKFYDSLIYKQSVAFDAPVIAPEKTFELLKQLMQLLPENGNSFRDLDIMGGSQDYDDPYRISEEERDDNELNGMMRNSLQFLIDMPNLVNESSCVREYLDFFNRFDRSTNLLSSINRDQHYGPNIKAYILYYKLKTVELCKLSLQKSVEKIPQKDLERLILLGKEMLPNVQKVEDYLEFYENKEMLVEGIVATLKKQVKDFNDDDEKLKSSSKIKVEIHNEFKSIKKACESLWNSEATIGFVPTALRDLELQENILKDRDLIMIAIEFEVCRGIKDKQVSSEDVGAQLKTKDKIKNFLTIA